MPIFRDISSFTTLTNDQIKEKVASGWKPYTQVSTTEKVDLYDFLSLVDLSAIYKAIEEVKTEIEEDIQPKLDNLQTQITSNDTDITNLNNNKKNKQTFSSGDTVTSISGGQTIEVTGTAKITCNVNAATFTELQDTAYLMALGKTEVEFRGLWLGVRDCQGLTRNISNPHFDFIQCPDTPEHFKCALRLQCSDTPKHF